jgi:hypothetical protein
MCVGTPEDIAKDGCKTNGGVSKKFYYALAKDIATVPGPPVAPADLAGAVTTTDDFVMNALKTFNTIDSDNQANGLESVSEGEINNLSGKSTFTFMVSGENATLEGWIKNFSNADLIFVITDNDGTQRILGNLFLPANLLSWKYATGIKVGDSKVIEVVVEAYGGTPVIFKGAAGVPLPA